MGIDVNTILSSMNLDTIFTAITNLFNWFLDGITSLLTSLGYFISLLITTIADISSYAVNFGGILQSVFNVLPTFYLQIVVFSILTTIILQSVRRFL